MKLLVLPILVPLSTAAVLMLAPKRPVAQRWISLTGSILQLASAVVGALRHREHDVDGEESEQPVRLLDQPCVRGGARGTARAPRRRAMGVRDIASGRGVELVHAAAPRCDATLGPATSQSAMLCT